MKKHTLLRISALFEGTSFIALLGIAVPMKHMAENAAGVRTVGPIHGVLFLAYIVIILMSYLKQHVDLKQLLVGLVASVVPFGTFIYTAKMLKDDDTVGGGES